MQPTKLLESASREEARLLEHLDAQRLPRHIAVIMDGNGRWAQRRHLPRVAGHRAGVESARIVIDTCARLYIPALTLYAFSMENWRRPKAEIDFLMRLLRQYLRKELPAIHRNNIRLQIIGRTDQLPQEVRADMAKGMALTAANTGMALTVALNYGGRAELVDAFNAILDRYRKIGANGNGALANFRVDEEMIAENLYTAGLPDPDLLIRTSGEMRVSNFLLWQIAYAEIYVTETLWPDFRREELYTALRIIRSASGAMAGWPRSVRKFRPCSRNELPQTKIAAASLSTEAKPGSGTVARVLTAAVLIPAVVALVWWGPPSVIAATGGVVALLALVEFFSLGEHLSLHGYRAWTGVCALANFLSAMGRDHGGDAPGGPAECELTQISGVPQLPLELVLFIFVLGCAAIIFVSRRPLAETLGDMGISAAGLLVIALPLSSVVRIHAADAIGPQLLLFTLVLVWAGDTLGYFVGRSLGRIPMAPQLSPKKTWEGAAANLLGSALVGVAFYALAAYRRVLSAGPDGLPGECRRTGRRSAGVRLQAQRGSEGFGDAAAGTRRRARSHRRFDSGRAGGLVLFSFRAGLAVLSARDSAKTFSHENNGHPRFYRLDRPPDSAGRGVDAGTVPRGGAGGGRESRGAWRADRAASAAAGFRGRRGARRRSLRERLRANRQRRGIARDPAGQRRSAERGHASGRRYGGFRGGGRGGPGSDLRGRAAGKQVALSNKEVLVAAGELVMAAAKAKRRRTAARG